MFSRVANYISNNFYNVFLTGLVILNIAPLLAPVFAHLGWNAPASIIYNVYSFFCHQFGWRSVHIFDYQCAWCARDMFIWGSFLFIAVLVKIRKVKGIKWYWIIPFTIPIALDGVIQTIATLFGYNSADPYYQSSNPIRMLTGAIFGTGLGLAMLPMLRGLTTDEKKVTNASND